MTDNHCIKETVINSLEKRQDRLEEVVDRLTAISADLSKMIAVHEQRLNQQERQLNNVESMHERRREEYDEKFTVVFEKIDSLRESSSTQCDLLSNKINDLEKQFWRLGGGFAVLAFIMAYGPSIVKVLNLQ